MSNTRMVALDLAVQSYSEAAVTGDILARAKAFEDYLNGGEQATVKPEVLLPEDIVQKLATLLRKGVSGGGSKT